MRLARPALALAITVDIVVVLVLAATRPTDGAGSVGVAVVLAPVGTYAVVRIAGRLRPGGWFPAAAGLVYALLPLVAAAFFLASYRHTYSVEVAPALVGLQAPGTFAFGVALALVTSFAPSRLVAAAGLAALVAAVAWYGFSDLDAIKVGVHETGWSVTFLEWLALAGLVGVVRRAALLAVGFAGWLVAVVLWGAAAGYDGGAFWRSLAAASPAVAILVSALALLVPSLQPGPARVGRRVH
jgi:hypothetical protein